MADESLRIKVGADVSDFDKGIKKVNESLGSFEKSTVKTGATLTNLSRIASDAPFGFIAIQNNLDPLIQSFGDLSKESGGTGNAIKALAGSLVGPAGLALGFSVVTALVTSAIQKYGSLSNAVIALSAAQDQASIKQRELTKAFNESLASSTGDLGKIKDYVGILNNVNASQRERLNAYNILKKDFPSIIQNQTFENVLNAQGAKLINEKAKQTADYILLKGRETALIKLVEKETQKQLDAEQNLQEFRKSALTFTNLFFSSFVGGGNAILGTQYRIRDLETEIKNAENTSKEFANQLSELRKQFTQTDQGILDPQAVIKAFQEQMKVVNANIAERNQLSNEALVNEYKINDELSRQEAKLKRIGEEYMKRFQKDKFIQGSKVNVELPTISQERINRIFAVIQEQYNLTVENLDFQRLINQGEKAAEIFSKYLNPVIDQFFTNIAEGQNAFKGLGNVIKQFAIEALKDLLKIATLSAIKAAFSKGEISFADAFSNLFNQNYGFTPQGSVSAGGMNVNVAGQFAVRGTDLVAIINQSQQRINRVG